MSCVHYQSTDPPPRERSYLDPQYPVYSYGSPSHSPRIKTSDVYRTEFSARLPGYYSSGYRTSDFRGNVGEATTAARGDPGYPDVWGQTTRPGACKYDAVSADKTQARMRFLEDSHVVMQTRNQNLITENKCLTTRLEEERAEVKRLEERVACLREQLERERSRLEEMKIEWEKRKTPAVETSETSTSNDIQRVDRGIQIWAVCKGCQRKLESCEKEPPSVTITKSELEVLERDMQTLRDTIIAREEAWDKAMEREQNYRQQLSRLTAETITARHVSETRHEELETLMDTLSEKESELRAVQKDNLYLNKLIAKLYNRHQRSGEDLQGCNAGSDMSEKDLKLIEEIVRRVSSAKGKQKSKAKSGCNEKPVHSGTYQSSPRESKVSKAVKDQPGPSREQKR